MEFHYNHGADAVIQRRIDHLLRQVAEAVAADARRACPRSSTPDATHTADTIRAVGNRVYVGDGTPTWFWLEYGTRSHVIRPVRKRALWWDGLPHPVKSVDHPGTPEYAYMRGALFQRRKVLLP